MYNRAFFVPFCEETKNYISSSFEQGKCVYRFPPTMSTKNEERFKKKSLYNTFKNLCSDILFALKLCRETNKNDVVVIWVFKYAVTIGFVFRLFHKKNEIIAMNFIDHSQGVKQKIKSIWMNYIFRNPYFHMSLNCIEYADVYCRNYKGIDKNRVFEMQDSYYLNMPKKDFDEGEGYIFCGGNIRDWDTYFEAAKLLPSYSFVAVASSSGIRKELSMNAPNNVQLYIDVSGKEFEQLLSNCTISVISVPSDIPNGFTVIFQSAFLNRPIIATDTTPIRKLIYDGSEKWGGLYTICVIPEILHIRSKNYMQTPIEKKKCAGAC